MRVLGIIPARGGSKRLPRKNLTPFLGKPLVARSIEAALASERLDRVVVSSDDDEILSVARGYDPKIALIRPDAISQDESLAIEYVRHALETLETAGEAPFDAVCIVQPSSPLTRAADIDATIELLEQSGADSAVSVMKIDHAIHPFKLKIMEDDRLLAYLEEERGRMAAHQIPSLYVRNGSVYVTRRATIDAGEVIGQGCRGHVMPRERSVDVNDEIDLAFAEFMHQRESQVSA